MKFLRRMRKGCCSCACNENKQGRFFSASLAQSHPDVAAAIGQELERQQNSIELIASENIVSRAVLEAQGSVMTNKYAEGYAGKRYYNGCEYVDKVEELAIDRAKKLFGCEYANVQPHSGSQANQAVFLALLKPGDTVMGMSLDAGGHLTHGSKVNESGKWFNSVSYDVNKDTLLLDYDAIEALAMEHKPKLIIAGASAYPRHMDFARFREIADKVGAILMADVAHYAGLVVTGLYPNPFPHAHVVTTTTHKTLRGPRGGMVLTNDEGIAKKINSAVFPGLQGGPLMHVIAAKAVAFGEALSDEYKTYMQAVLDNSRAMAKALMDGGIDIISDGTDSHMILVDLRAKGVTGKDVANGLDKLGITCNKNGVPFDTTSPMVTSGIRIGTPAGTTRGFGTQEFTIVGRMIARYIDALAYAQKENDKTVLSQVSAEIYDEVKRLCAEFPIY